MLVLTLYCACVEWYATWSSEVATTQLYTAKLLGPRVKVTAVSGFFEQAIKKKKSTPPSHQASRDTCLLAKKTPVHMQPSGGYLI